MVKSESVRILVIEDEVKLATHLSRALESEGHEARVVHDGKVALVEAREGAIGLDRILSTAERLEPERSIGLGGVRSLLCNRQRGSCGNGSDGHCSEKFFHVLVEASFIHACTFTTAKDARYRLKVNPL
jgi:CheY-like chemotaxis protein